MPIKTQEHLNIFIWNRRTLESTQFKFICLIFLWSLCQGKHFIFTCFEDHLVCHTSILIKLNP
jgi:hypothetical protein